MLSVFATAFALGLVFNAAPGPVFAATVRCGARGGFRPAMLVQLGSLAGDAVWAVLGLAGVGLLARLEPMRVPIGLAGAGYLLYLAWDAWRASRHVPTTAPAEDRNGSAVRVGALLSLTNPQNIGYWAALASALGGMGVPAPNAVTYAAFFAGFMSSSIVWSLIFAAIVDSVLGRAGVRWTRMTYRICALMFLALAVASLRQLWVSRDRVVSRRSALMEHARVSSDAGRDVAARAA
jgi:chemosensory pili system protein ChpE